MLAVRIYMTFSLHDTQERKGQFSGLEFLNIQQFEDIRQLLDSIKLSLEEAVKLSEEK